MKKLITFLTLIFLTASPAAFAEEETGKNFDEKKAKIASDIDERITKLQEHKTCVSAAADGEALKACHKNMKEWRHGEMTEHLGKRKDRLEKRMKRHEEKTTN